MEDLKQDNYFSPLDGLCFACDRWTQEHKLCKGCEQVYCTHCATQHVSEKKPLCTRCDTDSQKTRTERVLGKKMVELN